MTGLQFLRHRLSLLAPNTDSALHRECVEFFLGMRLWLDLPGLRAVHACWHADYMAALEPRLAPGRRLTPDLVAAASREGWMEFRAVEGLTKGLEVPLPPGHGFRDKDGNERHQVRVRWWDREAASYRQAALLDAERAAALPDQPVPTEAVVQYDDAKPVFFGHYWLTGRPQLLSPKIACIDYSAGKDGPLVAYRWDGEELLDESRFIASS